MTEEVLTDAAGVGEGCGAGEGWPGPSGGWCWGISLSDMARYVLPTLSFSLGREIERLLTLDLCCSSNWTNR